MAAAYLAKGARDKARAALEKALSITPTYSTARINLARLDKQDGNLDMARSHYDAVLRQTPNHVGALLGLARLEALAGQQKEAVAWLKKAHEANPEALQPGVLLVQYYLSTGKPLKTKNVARALAEAHPNNPAALEALDNTQIANSELASAIASLEKLTELKPDLLTAHMRLGQAHLQQGDIIAASTAFNRALELKPNDLMALASLVVVELKAQRTENALSVTQKIQSAHAESPMGFQLEGDIHRQAKAYQTAAASYAEAYRRGPSARLVLLIYQMRKKAGDVDAAMSALEKWTEKNSDDATVRLVLANEYQTQHRYKEAIREYERVTALSPDNVNALNNLAWLYHAQDDTRALDYARKANELAPARPEVLDTYGWIELQRGNPVQGLHAIQSAARYLVDVPTVRYHLAAALDKNGQQEAARKELERLLKSSKDFPELAEAQQLLSRLQAGSSAK